MIAHVIRALSVAIAYFFSAHLHAVVAEVRRVERWLMFAGLSAAAASIYAGLRRRSQRALVAAAAAVPLMPAPCIGLGTLTVLRPA